MNERASRSGVKPRSSRVVLAILGGFLALTAVAVVLAAWTVNRYVVFELEVGQDYRSVRVYTPFGFFPLEKQKEAPPTLWAAVYPGSGWEEENLSDFYDGPAGRENKIAQLTVLRFYIRASFAQAESWYEKRLRSDFTRSKGWNVGSHRYEQEWLRQVQSEPSDEAVVFRQQLPRRVRGVILEPRPSPDGVLATLYDYQETGPH